VSTALFVVVSRYRVPIGVCLTVPAALVLTRVAAWVRTRRRRPAAGTLALALVLVAALHYDQIYRRLVPHLQPDGFVETENDITVIRDEPGMRRRRFTRLAHPDMIVEKALMVPPRLVPAGRAWIHFAYAAESKARCVMKLNGHRKRFILTPTTLDVAEVHVPAEWARAGRNVVRFSAAEGSQLRVGVGERFRFGRSRWRDAEGEWHARYLDVESLITRTSEHMVGGEYLIRLSLRRLAAGARPSKGASTRPAGDGQ